MNKLEFSGRIKSQSSKRMPSRVLNPCVECTFPSQKIYFLIFFECVHLYSYSKLNGNPSMSLPSDLFAATVLVAE